MVAVRWWEQARTVRLIAAAAALGLRTDRSGKALTPCPCCGADVRSKSHGDKRGPVGLYRKDGRDRWHCYKCEQGGDVVSLASAVICRSAATRDLTPEQRRDLWDWFTAHGWVTAREDYTGSCPRVPRPMPVKEPEPDPPPSYPPHGDVLDLWERCKLAWDDAAVRAYLEARKLDPCKVTDRDLARALPEGLTLPSWAKLKGSTWTAAGYRLILPLWDARGELVSLRGRNLDRTANPKGAAPAGFALRGSVLACGLVRQIMTSGALPSWWPASTPFVLVISEGEVDWLLWATCYGDAAVTAPGALGIVAGSWTTELATRIPDGTRVVIRTDNDETGDKYALRVAETFKGRNLTLKRGGRKGEGR